MTSNSSIRQIIHRSQRHRRSAGLAAIALALTAPTIVLLSPPTPVSAFSLPGIAPATDLPNGGVGGGSNQLDGLTVSTDVVSSTPDGTGHYDVVYDIKVANSGPTPRIYDLTDTLRPGVGAVVVQATVASQQRPDISRPARPPGQRTTLARQQRIGGADGTNVDRYRLSARFTTDLDPADAVSTATSADCTLDRNETPGNTGLRNEVTLTADGRTANDSACTPFGHLDQSTRVVSAAAWGPANTTITTETVITNDSDAPAAYSLSQVIPGGADNGLVFAAWTGPGGSGLFDARDRDAVASIAIERLLEPPGDASTGTDTYTVTALYDRSSLLDSAAPACLRIESFVLTASQLSTTDACSTVDRFDVALRMSVAAVNGQPTTLGAPGALGASTVRTGDLVTFAIEVTNEGNVPATDIEITDIVPDGYDAAPQIGWSERGGALVSDRIAGPLAPGATIEVPITLTVVESSARSVERMRRLLLNSAAITSADNDSSPFTPPPIDADARIDGTATALVAPNGSNLGVSIMAADTFVTAGSPTGFGITVTNSGPSVIDDAVIEIDVPAGLAFDGSQAANAGWIGPRQGPIRRSVTSPGPGGIDRYLVELVAEPVDRALAPRTRSAQPAGSGCATLDPDELNHPLMTLVRLRYDSTVVSDDCDYARNQRFSVGVDLAMSVVDDVVLEPGDTHPVDLGDSVAFRVGVRNRGSVPVGDLAVSVAIPPGLAIVDQPGWSVAGQTVTSTDSSTVLAPGEVATIATLTAFVIDLGDPLLGLAPVAEVVGGRPTISPNREEVAPVFDGTAGRDSEPLLTVAPDVSVEDRVSADGTHHEIEVTHRSGRPATNVVITDTVPTGYRLDPVLGPVAGWSGPAQGPVRLVLPLLAVGQRRTLMLPLVATADSGTAGGTAARNRVAISYDDAYLVENNVAEAVPDGADAGRAGGDGAGPERSTALATYSSAAARSRPSSGSTVQASSGR